MNTVTFALRATQPKLYFTAGLLWAGRNAWLENCIANSTTANGNFSRNPSALTHRFLDYTIHRHLTERLDNLSEEFIFPWRRTGPNPYRPKGIYIRLSGDIHIYDILKT